MNNNFSCLLGTNISGEAIYTRQHVVIDSTQYTNRTLSFLQGVDRKIKSRDPIFQSTVKCWKASYKDIICQANDCQPRYTRSVLCLIKQSSSNSEGKCSLLTFRSKKSLKYLEKRFHLLKKMK